MSLQHTLPLFPHAHARRSDPPTSHEAAASLTPEALQDSQKAVLEMLERYGPRTDTDLVALVRDYSSSRVRTARAELVTLGRVADSGQRIVLMSGRKSIVWKLAK